jgi:hypothetical protein
MTLRELFAKSRPAPRNCSERIWPHALFRAVFQIQVLI